MTISKISSMTAGGATEMSRKVVDLKMTCVACPSQWEGQLEDGRYFYGRYRWGYLYVGAAADVSEAIMASPGREDEVEVLVAEQVGDDLAGDMSTTEMMRRAGLTYGE
jgi:hypothetical protein